MHQPDGWTDMASITWNVILRLSSKNMWGIKLYAANSTYLLSKKKVKWVCNVSQQQQI